MQQNSIRSNNFISDQQSSSEFIGATRDMVVQHSHELHHTEIQEFIDRGKIQTLLLKLWEFTGSCTLWPATLLERTDVTASLRKSLQLRLHQKNGLSDSPPFTTLFQQMAKSLGVSLPDPAPQGWLISSVVTSAENSPLPEALGKYFANECLPEWPALAHSLERVPNANLDFFNQNQQTESLYHELSHDQDKTVFSEAAQAYAIQRTIYMNQIRALI